MKRLSATSLDQVHDALLPAYARVAPSTILHIGVGAFARAHLGVYVDDLSATGWSGSVRGVSLRSPHAEQQLAPQDCLYSVTTREPGAAPEPPTEPPTRIIGSFRSVATGAGAAIEAIADPTVTMVTLTVTEKAYEYDGTIGSSKTGCRFQCHDTGIDSQSPSTVGVRSPEPGARPPDHATVPAVLARGLEHRYRDNGAPLVIASLDNVRDNGIILRGLVMAAAKDLVEAESIDPIAHTEATTHPGSIPGSGFVSWIERSVRFPCSVVDRLVPATEPADLDEIAGRIGVRDEAAVIGEEHRSWVIESVDGLPPLERVGVEVVDDITPYEIRKLWLLNGPHSATAFCGLLRGHDTIAEAISDPVITRFVEGLVEQVLEVAPTAGLHDDLDPRGFAYGSLRRFANDSLGHTCRQVGMDGSSKLAQRVLPVMAARRAHGLDTTGFATIIALWLAAVTGSTIAGGATLQRTEDPAAEILCEASSAGSHDDVARSLHEVFGDAVVDHLDVITDAFAGLTTTSTDPLGENG